MRTLQPNETMVLTDLTNHRKISFTLQCPKLNWESLYIFGLNKSGNIFDLATGFICSQNDKNAIFQLVNKQAYTAQVEVDLNVAGKSGIWSIVFALLDDESLNNWHYGLFNIFDEGGQLANCKLQFSSLDRTITFLHFAQLDYNDVNKSWSLKHTWEKGAFDIEQFVKKFGAPLVEDAVGDWTPLPSDPNAGPRISRVPSAYRNHGIAELKAQEVWQLAKDIDRFSLRLAQKNRGYWTHMVTDEGSLTFSYASDPACFLLTKDGILSTDKGTDGVVFEGFTTSGISFTDKGLVMEFDVEPKDLPQDTDYLLFYYFVDTETHYKISDIELMLSCHWPARQGQVEQSSGMLYGNKMHNASGILLGAFDVQNRRFVVIGQATNLGVQEVYDQAFDKGIDISSYIGTVKSSEPAPVKRIEPQTSKVENQKTETVNAKNLRRASRRRKDDRQQQPTYTNSPKEQNPQLTGSISRYQLPAPISGLYCKLMGAQTFAHRYGLTLLLVEGIFRFFAYINVSNAIALEVATEKKVADWIRMLCSPSMGKLLGISRSARKRILAKGEKPFVPELFELLESEEWSSIERFFPAERNTFAHRRLGISEDQAARELEKVTPVLQSLLHRVQWLRYYRFGSFVGMRKVRRRGKGYQAQWRISRGREEDGEGITVHAASELPGEEVLLLNEDCSSALILSPFFLRSDTQGSYQYLWLDGVGLGDDPQAVRYRHPVLVEQFEDVRVRIEGEMVPFSEYRENPQDWHRVESLELDADSIEDMLHARFPVGFQDTYQEIGLIGQGGMSMVYEVLNKAMQQKSALKVLKTEQIVNAKEIVRFQREAQMLRKLQHPGIVRVYTVGNNNGRPFIEMELLEGKSLKETLEEQGSFEWQQAVGILTEILGTLDYIHGKGIWHRDLKPSNIMFCDGKVKLIDFGIAKEQDGKGLTRTGTMSVLGTELYMAPEQWNNEASHLSDLYSCGVLLGTLIGCPPLMPNLPPSISQVKTIPSWLVKLHDKATRTRPQDRFSSAQEILDIIQAPPTKKSTIPQNYSYPPSLFIGLGGTGIKTLRKLRAQFFANTGTTSPAGCAYLGLDLDEISFAASPDPQLERMQLPKESQIGLSSVVSELLQHAQDAGWHWLDSESISQDINLSYGSGQYRTLARAAFLHKAPEIANKIAKHCADIRSMNIDSTHLDFNKKTHVHIVSSVAGGTGAGILLDILAMIATITEATISVWLVLPHVFKKVSFNDQKMMCNGGATLRELNHYLSNPFPAYGIKGRRQDFSPSLARCVVIDARNDLGHMISGPEQAHQTIAESIFQEYAPDKLAMFLKAVHINRYPYFQQQIGQEGTTNNWKTCFSAIGQAVVPISKSFSAMSDEDLLAVLTQAWKAAQPWFCPSRSASHEPVTDFFVTLPNDTLPEQVSRCKDLLKKKVTKTSPAVVLQGEGQISMRIEQSAFPVFYLSSLHEENGLAAVYQKSEEAGKSSHVVSDTEQFVPLIPTNN